MNDELKGKIAIVTGASQGIGRAISLVLSNKGINLIIASRNHEKLLSVQEEIINDGGKAVAVKADVGLIEDCRHLA